MKNFNVLHSEHPPFLLGVGWGGGGLVEPTTKFSKTGNRERLGSTFIFRGGWWETFGGGWLVVTFVRGVLQFLHKNKI